MTRPFLFLLLISIAALLIAGGGSVFYYNSVINKPTNTVSIVEDTSAPAAHQSSPPHEIVHLPQDDATPVNATEGRIYGRMSSKGLPEASGYSIHLFASSPETPIFPATEPMAVLDVAGDGQFSFSSLPFGPYLVCAMKDDIIAYNGVKLTATRPHAQIVLTPQQAASLSGIVKTPQGAPISDATILLHALRYGSPQKTSLYTMNSALAGRSDADGRFQLSWIPIPSEQSAVSFQLLGRSPGLAPGLSDFHTSAASEVEIVLSPGTTVSGRVRVRDTGAPAAGVTISAGEGVAMQTPASDSKGLFNFSNLATGAYNFRIEHPTWISATGDIPVEVAEGTESRDVLIEVCAGGLIAGRVYDDLSGEGVKNATLACSSNQLAVRRKVLTNAEGIYELTGLPPGDYTLAVHAPEGYATSGRKIDRTKPVRLGLSASEKGMDFILRAGPTILGEIVDETGEAVMGVSVDALSNSEELAGIAESDDEGKFALVLYEPLKEVTLESTKEGFVANKTGPITIVQGRAQEVRIVLERGVSLSGRVVDKLGTPAAGAFVYLIPGGRSGALEAVKSLADEASAFHFGELAPGTYGMMASNRGRFSEIDLEASSMLEVTLKPRENRSNLMLRVEEESLSIAGHVLDDARQPMRQVKITALNQDGVGGSATSDTAGKYEIKGLAAGEYVLTAGRGRARGERIEDVAAGSIGIDFTLGGTGAVEGEIVDSKGKPVPAFEMAHIPGEAEKPGDLARFQAFEDPGGFFKLESVQAGDATLFVRSGGYQSAQAYVPLIESGKTVSGIKLVLAEGYSLRGQVLDTHGAPLAGARIVLDDGESASLSREKWLTESNSEGHRVGWFVDY